MELAELCERADELMLGYTSPAEAMELIDAAIDLCAASEAQQEWQCRQVSHAIAMAGWGLWRAVGAALIEAFRPGLIRVGNTCETFTVADLRRLRAGLCD